MATGRGLKELAARLQQGAIEVALPQTEIDSEVLEAAETLTNLLKNEAFMEMLARRDPAGASRVYVDLAYGVRDDLPLTKVVESVILLIKRKGNGREKTEAVLLGRIDLCQETFYGHPEADKWNTKTRLEDGITSLYIDDGYTFRATFFDDDGSGSWGGYIQRTIGVRELAASHGSRLEKIIAVLLA